MVLQNPATIPLKLLSEMLQTVHPLTTPSFHFHQHRHIFNGVRPNFWQDYFDVTPIIGREYPTAKIKDILNAPNKDEQLRDLAITICERGVVFFRAPQDDLTVEEQKHVTDLLGKLTGRPEENGLHVHPLYNDENNIPMADGSRDPHM